MAPGMAEEVPKTRRGGARSPAPTSAPGPETPTLAERLIAAFHLPYAAGCALVGLVLFGVLDVWLTAYAATLDLSRAVATALNPASVLTALLVASAFYAPGYMRGRLVQAETSLSTLLPDGRDGYRRVFAGVSALRPQLVVWALFFVTLLVALSAPALLGTGPSSIGSGGGPGTALELIAGVYDLASYAVATLGLSSVVWTYWSISRGIHRFGGAALALRPYFEDAFLGLKPVGSLALSVASAYFGFIALFLLILAASPTSPTLGDIVGVGGFLSGLIVLGVLLFFLPLRRLHHRMIREKHREVGGLREKLAPVFQEPVQAGPLRDIGHLFRLDMMDRKVSSMALWPFDLRILGRLSVIALSVTAILISRIVGLLLRI